MAGFTPSALRESILKLRAHRLWVQILSAPDWLYDPGQLNLSEAGFPQWQGGMGRGLCGATQAVPGRLLKPRVLALAVAQVGERHSGEDTAQPHDRGAWI